MLSLHYLYEDYDQARAFIARWPHDADTLDELLPYFRISSNAIYPFRHEGEVYLLRAAPVLEKQASHVRGELDFIAYLRAQGAPVLRYVPSKAGNTLEVISYGGEEWICTVSKRVPGVQAEALIDEGDDPDALYVLMGQTLGTLHALSAGYTPPSPVRTCDSVLRWVRDVLGRMPEESAALQEADLIEEMLCKLPRTQETYGMIHYDFEPDNVFFDPQAQGCHVIDFDDCMLHYYAMDVAASLLALSESIPDVRRLEQARLLFLEGYRNIRPLDDAQLTQPIWNRYHGLYKYARAANALEPETQGEPEWMVELRAKLHTSMSQLQKPFGLPL